MTVKFKRYDEPDFPALVQCMEELQDFLAAADPLQRLRRLTEYGKRYTNRLIRTVNKQDGLILLACDGGTVVGCIVGMIEKQTGDNLLECVSTRAGRILELFVRESYRNRGVGKSLMKQMEDYFRQNECDVVRVGFFEPNKTAHEFYLQLDYQDRVIDMMKLLE